MDGFKVSVSNLKATSEAIFAYKNRIKDEQADVLSIALRLRGAVACEDQIRQRLKNVCITMSGMINDAQHMGEGLDRIVAFYEKAEKNITGSYLHTVVNSNGTISQVIDSGLFDENGSYGGDQGWPQSLSRDSQQWKDLAKIVRQHYPNMTDRQVDEYLRKLNSEGCGYVAVINTIFSAYEGREAEFERTFGIPMYKNGDLNYNELLVDFYSATDNRNRNGKLNSNEDWNIGSDGFFRYIFGGKKHDTTGNGTSSADREDRLALYLEEKGADVDLKVEHNVKVTPENFAEIAKDHYVVMAEAYIPLRDVNGTIVNPVRGGHAMMVTGVTSDGRFIVSSWGKEYYLDPADVNNPEYGDSRRLDFETYQYE